MIPPPIVLGLFICEKVILEEYTKNVTIVSAFKTMRVDVFPTPPQQFTIYTVLTDGEGDATIEVVGTRIDTDEVIYAYRNRFRFLSRLTEVNLRVRVTSCRFPAPGRYLFSFLVDGEWVAHRAIDVLLKE